MKKKAYDFKYFVRAHFGMFNRDYGCDYYQVTVDGKINTGGEVMFMKKGFKIMNHNEIKEYYSKY